MSRHRKSLFTLPRIFGLGALLLVIILLGGYLLLDGKDMGILNAQGIIANKQKELLIFTTLLGLVIVIPVFIMLFGFAWRYREGNKKQVKHTPDADGNRFLELLWWGIPIIIIAVLSVVTWTSSHDLDPYRSLDSDKKPITIKVVALQWKWLFIYPDQKIATVNEVRFPEKTPVNFEITADAPMSSFWIPNLGSQVYAMNGMTSQLKLEADGVGEYRGTNTNINGEGYAKMQFTARSTSQSDFDRWSNIIATSGNSLDWATYETVAKPSSDMPVTYYAARDTTVFDKVLAKYMDHAMSSMEHN